MLSSSRLIERLRQQKLVILALVIFFFFRLLFDCGAIYLIAISQIHSSINSVVTIAKSDITYTNGNWNTSEYNSDPNIPGVYRFYIITKDGFIIDRWRPIPGYLDTSDYKQLIAYVQPKTVRTVAGQTWRLLSLPLNYQGNNVGVLTVGKGIDPTDTDPATDSELQSAAQGLTKNLSLNTNAVNTNRLDLKSIPSDISFQIVDQYNHIVLKSDHSSSIEALPNYIDPSYIADDLQRPFLKTVTASTGEKFLVQTSPLTNKQGVPYGTIIVARTVTPTYQLVRDFFWVDGSVGMLIIIGASTVIVRLRKNIRKDRKIEEIRRLHQKELMNISFNKEKCLIFINEYKLPVTYATNQYYLCVALFSKPNKKWEVDEILDKFGIENELGAWRKIYDAMASINKKSSAVMQPKLIITSNKTYLINPSLVSLVNKRS